MDEDLLMQSYFMTPADHLSAKECTSDNARPLNIDDNISGDANSFLNGSLDMIEY